MDRLKNKTAIITGAAQGIGRAAAILFAREGAKVIIADINAEMGRVLEEEIRSQKKYARFVETDVAQDDSVRALIESVKKREGNLHILYNNASVFAPGKDGRVIDISVEDWDRIMAVNLRSIFLCCKYGIPEIISGGGGAIINTASSAGVTGIPDCDAYTATKGATISLTRSLAVEYGPKNIRVNCIAPAGIVTPMLNQSNLEDKTFDEERFLKLRSPSRRYGTPEEIAQTALFLASSEASYINGAVIVADGGITVNGDLSRLERYDEEVNFGL